MSCSVTRKPESFTNGFDLQSTMQAISPKIAVHCRNLWFGACISKMVMFVWHDSVSCHHHASNTVR